MNAAEFLHIHPDATKLRSDLSRLADEAAVFSKGLSLLAGFLVIAHRFVPPSESLNIPKNVWRRQLAAVFLSIQVTWDLLA